MDYHHFTKRMSAYLARYGVTVVGSEDGGFCHTWSLSAPLSACALHGLADALGTSPLCWSLSGVSVTYDPN